MQIYKFNNILKPVLWGGSKLLSFKGIDASNEPIGESWELSAMPGHESVVADGDDRGLTLSQLVKRYGADLVGKDVYRRYGDQFPLLIKLIDACRDLSLQVHPDDNMARRLHGCAGKNEMWYILETEDGAVIRNGFNRTITPEAFDRMLADGTVLDVVNSKESRPGDVFYVPAGQIHAIGAGNLLVEVQQASDITYRVWDYNRMDADGNLRPLHVQEAREALSYAAHDGLVPPIPSLTPGFTPLVMSPDFDVYRLDFDNGYTLDMAWDHSFVALMCIEGQTELTAASMPTVALRQGETALVPAVVERLAMSGKASLMMTTVPVVPPQE